MRRVLVAVVVAVGLSACGGSGESCIVLANGGNKLCGSDAAAWCRSTDSIRNGDNSQAPDCPKLEQQYPQ